MQTNIKLKYSVLFIAFIMCAFNLFFPLTTVMAEEEENPLRCTYGVYSAEEHGITESDVDYYDTMNFNGFCQGVYQYFIDNYPNENFITFTEFKHYVSNILALPFWNALTLNGYYLNTYCDDDTIIVLAQHQPLDILPPVFAWYYTNNDLDINITLGVVQDTTYFVYDNGKMFGYTPPVNIVTSVDTVEYDTRGIATSFLMGNFSEDEYLIDFLNNDRYFGYMFIIHISDIPNLTFSFSGVSCVSIDTIGVFSEEYHTNEERLIDATFRYNPVFTTFPIWKSNEEVFECYNRSSSRYYSYLSSVYVFTQNRPLFSRDYDLAPIIASNYAEVPIATPTFTPTPIPPITLYPTPTPYVVETMEGVGQMFSLFTRKYTFNINGVEIGIRPFYLVLACFIVGSIFTMVQGGNKS